MSWVFPQCMIYIADKTSFNALTDSSTPEDVSETLQLNLSQVTDWEYYEDNETGVTGISGSYSGKIVKVYTYTDSTSNSTVAEASVDTTECVPVELNFTNYSNSELDLTDAVFVADADSIASLISEFQEEQEGE